MTQNRRFSTTSEGKKEKRRGNGDIVKKYYFLSPVSTPCTNEVQKIKRKKKTFFLGKNIVDFLTGKQDKGRRQQKIGYVIEE